MIENSKYQSLPSFLFGQSMGGAVALKVHFKQPRAWDGAVLVAPMCKVTVLLVLYNFFFWILFLNVNYFSIDGRGCSASLAFTAASYVYFKSFSKIEVSSAKGYSRDGF